MAVSAVAGLAAELPDGVVVTDPDILTSYRHDRAADPAAGTDRKSTRLNSSHIQKSRMPSSA